MGEDRLQELAECLEALDFDPGAEIEVDRQIHKSFTYGNNQSNAGLGLSHVNAGICDQQVEVQAATINFKTGVAIFRRLCEKQFVLQRSQSNHLLLPMTAFAGREDVLSGLWASELHETVSLLSKTDPDEVEKKSSEGDPQPPSAEAKSVA